MSVELTKAQRMMIEDGAPIELVTMTAAERKAVWEKNPPKPLPNFNMTRTQDAATLKAIEDLEQQKKMAKAKVAKSTHEDHTGQRWDFQRGGWVENKEPETMISITTNTRGSSQMSSQKAYVDMSGPELVTAYNKMAKANIKKFKDRATGLKRIAEFEKNGAAVGPLTGRPISEIKAKAAKVAKNKEPASASENKLAAEFGARPGSFREKLLIALDDHYGKAVTLPVLLKAVYGSQNTENVGALGMVIKGALKTIEKNSLPYLLVKEKNAAKEVTYSLCPN